MTLLSEASFLVTPNGYKASKLYAAIPTNGNGDMTVTRATAATIVDENGLVNYAEVLGSELVTNGDYTNGLTGWFNSTSLPVQNFNVINQSLHFENTSGTVTFFSSASFSVDASKTYKFTINTVKESGIDDFDITLRPSAGSPVVETITSTHQSGLLEYYFTSASTQTLVIQFTQRNTIKAIIDNVSVKEATRDNVPRIDYTGGGCPSILLEPLRTNIVLNSATVVTQTITTAAVANTLSFYGTGTITLSGTFAEALVGTGATNRVSLTFTPTAGSLVLTVSGTCTNGQLEEGAYPTSYIPTDDGARVTRNADVINRNDIYTNKLITVAGGTWFVHLINNTAFTADSNIGAIYLDTSSAGYTNGLMLRKQTTGRIRLQTYVSTTGSFIYTTTTDTVKILFKWNGATADVFVNGAKVVSATPFTSTNMQYLASNSAIYALIKETMLFPKPLDEDQCIALTTL